MPKSKKKKAKRGKRVCYNKQGYSVDCKKQAQGKRAWKLRVTKLHTKKKTRKTAAPKRRARTSAPRVVARKTKRVASARKRSMALLMQSYGARVRACKSPRFNNLSSKSKACSCVKTGKGGKRIVAKLQKRPCKSVVSMEGSLAIRRNKRGEFNAEHRAQRGPAPRPMSPFPMARPSSAPMSLPEYGGWKEMGTRSEQFSGVRRRRHRRGRR